MSKEVYMKFSGKYLYEVMDIILQRHRGCKIDIYHLIEDMAENLSHMDETFDRHGVDLDLCETDIKEFYTHFAFLVKFMYPIMEQLQAIVDHNTEIYVTEN